MTKTFAVLTLSLAIFAGLSATVTPALAERASLAPAPVTQPVSGLGLGGTRVAGGALGSGR